MKRRSITAGISSVSKKLKSHAQISKSRFGRAKYCTHVVFFTEVPVATGKNFQILIPGIGLKVAILQVKCYEILNPDLDMVFSRYLYPNLAELPRRILANSLSTLKEKWYFHHVGNCNLLYPKIIYFPAPNPGRKWGKSYHLQVTSTGQRPTNDVWISLIPVFLEIEIGQFPFFLFQEVNKFSCWNFTK